MDQDDFKPERGRLALHVFERISRMDGRVIAV